MAASGDFRPKDAAQKKIKKKTGQPVLELESTVDILAALAEGKARSNNYRLCC